MSFLLAICYALIFLGIAAFALVIEKYKRMAVTEQERVNHLDDILGTAPEGFYVEIHSKTSVQRLCSRRLCLLLNLVSTKATFQQVLTSLSEKSQTQLQDNWQNMQTNNKPFELVVQNAFDMMQFRVTGRLLDTPYQQQKAYILWFENISDSVANKTHSATKYNKLSAERDLLIGLLKSLDFPITVQSGTGKTLFQNRAPKAGEDDWADLQWQETPLILPNKERATLKYALDKTAEETLSAQLADMDRAQKRVLKELPCAVCLFNAESHLVFANKAFTDLWKLDAAFVKKEPSYEAFLNRLQESGFLPQVKDFAQYKKRQKDLFSRLTKSSEEFIYLENSHIIRRLMIPYAMGGILFVDEEKGA